MGQLSLKLAFVLNDFLYIIFVSSTDEFQRSFDCLYYFQIKEYNNLFFIFQL